MNAIGRCDAAARERHRALDFIGLRAHATTVGLIQLCEELLNSGVLSPEGLERIKGPPLEHVGTLEDFEDAMETYHGA